MRRSLISTQPVEPLAEGADAVHAVDALQLGSQWGAARVVVEAEAPVAEVR
jgi:hypothetical protein